MVLPQSFSSHLLGATAVGLPKSCLSVLDTDAIAC